MLFAFLTPLAHFDGEGAETRSYSHGTTTCLEDEKVSGIKLILTQKDRCGAHSYPGLEIEIRQSSIKAHESLIIGPDNWAFRCLRAEEPCEQVPSGKVVFEYLEDGSISESKTLGIYELRFRGGADVVERGKFTVDCILPCTRD